MDEKLFLLGAAALTAASPVIGALLQYLQESRKQRAAELLQQAAEKQQQAVARRDAYEQLLKDYDRVCGERDELRDLVTRYEGLFGRLPDQKPAPT